MHTQYAHTNVHIIAKKGTFVKQDSKQKRKTKRPWLIRLCRVGQLPS